MTSALSSLPSNEIRSLTGHEGPVLAVRFSGDGKYCFTCGNDRTLRLYNPHKVDPSSTAGKSSAMLVKVYSGGHGHAVQDVAIASDNSQFASVGRDKIAFLWDVSTGRIKRRFQGHDHGLNAVKFNKDDSVIVTASYDTTVCCWDARSHSRTPIQTLSEAKDSVTSLVVTDHDIITGSVDGCVRRYDLRAGRMWLDEVHDAVGCVSLSRDSNCMLVSRLDSSLLLLDKASGQLLSTYRGAPNSSYRIESALSADDAHVIAGAEDGRLRFWDLVEGRVVATKQAHAKGLCGLSVHPDADERLLLTCSYDGTAKLWGDSRAAQKAEAVHANAVQGVY